MTEDAVKDTARDTVKRPKNDTTAVTASIMTVTPRKRPAAEAASGKPQKAAPEKRLADWMAFDPEMSVPRLYVTAYTEEEALVKAKETDEKIDHVRFSRFLDAPSTDAFSREILTEFRRRTKAIKDSIRKMDASFEKIAFNLHWINAKEAYKAEGFGNIAEYAEATFDYQKTTCYGFISVVDRFAKRDEKGAILESFDDRVKGYSAFKLVLMTGLTDEQIGTLNPGMTVRDIKAYIKSLKEESLPGPSDDSTGPDGKEDTGAPASAKADVVVDAREIDRQVIISCKGRKDFDAKTDDINRLVVRVLKAHADAVIEVSYILPDKE